MSQFLTLEEAAERLGVEYKTIYRLVRAGDLPAGKVGRIYRIREDDLLAYFDRQKQLLAEQTKRTGPTALEGRRCGACDKPLLSELSTAGRCDECGRDICQACWAIHKVRRCAAHPAPAAAPPAAGPGPSAPGAAWAALGRTTAGADDTGPRRRADAKEEVAAAIARLRQAGCPVVTPPEVETLAGGFLRAFAQRLETIDELPDPLTRRAILLEQARVKHVLEPAARRGPDLSGPWLSRFSLRSGGWGRPRAALVLEAHCLIRGARLTAPGYDADPLDEADLSPLLHELRERAKREACFHVALLGSPTGWCASAVALVTQAQGGRAFRDRRVGVALHDLHADAAYLDESDARLWGFWALLAPRRYADAVARCTVQVRELVARFQCVSLKTAVESCAVYTGWVRAAFDELATGAEFELTDLPKVGMALARRPV
jgi:excisionase family DNA binding protein